MIVGKFKDFIVLNKDRGISGQQQIYRFPNGYGASVVDGIMLHSYPFYVEVAVIEFKEPTEAHIKEGLDFAIEITYDTPITDDVIVLNTHEELFKTLTDIKNLEGK